MLFAKEERGLTFKHRTWNHSEPSSSSCHFKCPFPVFFKHKNQHHSVLPLTRDGVKSRFTKRFLTRPEFILFGFLVAGRFHMRSTLKIWDETCVITGNAFRSGSMCKNMILLPSLTFSAGKVESLRLCEKMKQSNCFWRRYFRETRTSNSSLGSKENSNLPGCGIIMHW